jgi:predicted transposase/invertase (TIGR01784 family)
MHQEETIETDYEKKGIRLDVYAKGSDKSFNLEMQATDTGELPERARYYQGVLDVDELNQGADYKDLKNSYVIFSCVPDIFGEGLGKYTFENFCIEKPKLKLNDRAYKLFFIAENYDKILNEKQRAFLKLVTSNDSSTEFTKRISKLVEDAKHNTQWRKQFMEFERYMAYSFREGKAEGISEGQNQKAVDTSIKLLEKGISPEVIAECVQLPLEKVLELKEQITVKA